MRTVTLLQIAADLEAQADHVMKYSTASAVAMYSLAESLVIRFDNGEMSAHSDDMRIMAQYALFQDKDSVEHNV
jgi:hypothetical protein